MKIQKYLVLNIALALLAGTIVFYLSQEGYLAHPELFSLDISFRLRGDLPCHPKIVVIEITDRDILEVGRWPWKRSWHAAIAKALSDLGARFVYFDIIFSEASSEEDDYLFEESLRVSKNVYLPFAFQPPSFDINEALLPLTRFSPYIKGTGAVNIYPDIDGKLRRIPLMFLGKDNFYPHAALKIALDYKEMKTKEVEPSHIIAGDDSRSIVIPLVENNQMLINWAGKWQDTFKHYSFMDVLAGYQDALEHKRPRIDLNDFKDSICIIGLTAIGLYDIKPVPLQPEYPGIGVIANTINTVLEEKFIYYPPVWAHILVLYILTLMPAFLIFGERPLQETIFVFLTAALYFSANFLMFQKGLRLDLFTPMAGLFVSYMTVGTCNFVRVAIEKKRFFGMSITDGLTGLYNIRYFKMILETELMLAKSDPNKVFSIVMSDIDHFKKFNDTYGHQVGDLVLKSVAAALKNSVRSMDIVARYGGEEMVILLRGTPFKYAMTVGEKIRKNVEDCLVKDEQHDYKVTISIGVSVFGKGDTVDKVIKRADEGLYQAKEGGRNQVRSVEAMN